jgi:Flp pilus assembly protein TadB
VRERQGGNDVLSDHERRSINDIERRISAEDPDLVRRFADEADKARPRRWPYFAVLTIATILLLAGLILALPVLGVAGFMLAGATGFALWLLRMSGRTPDPKDDS